ncbi:INO80 complex subunit 1 like protein [Verticillium longisporum]|nr:INO80 complex subunit 1 like protein [Verticillium longisporum]
MTASCSKFTVVTGLSPLSQDSKHYDSIGRHPQRLPKTFREFLKSILDSNQLRRTTVARGRVRPRITMVKRLGRNMSPYESPLSSMTSSDSSDNETPVAYDAYRPTKRQKVGEGSTTSSAAVHEPDHEPEAEPEPEVEAEAEVEPEAEPEPEADPLDGMSDVSEDTEGDIPSSPINARLDEEDFQEQITHCAWDGCGAGDFGNMDKLVEHIHNDHIESRQKKYTCEWNGCNRKSMAHASGYALKAHMRSHTREKPFYCYLPECDRAFTRSDALAKHMRTVHETEALRPSDPVPKSMQPG